MNQTRVKIECLLRISHELTFDEQDIKGRARLNSESDITLFTEFNDGLIEDLSFKPEGYRFSIGSEVSYIISLYHTGEQFASYQNFIFHHLNFSQNSRLSDDYIIYEESYNSIQGEPPISKNLKLFADFIKILSEKYFYRDSQIILFSKTHCEINVQPRNYEQYKDLAQIYCDLKLDQSLKKAIEWLSSETTTSDDENLTKALGVHQSERYSIAASEFIDNLITLDKKERVFSLLKNIDTIYQSILSKYALYLDDFKFSKFSEKITKYSEEFLNKVNKVISDLQTQVLAIPLAASVVTVFKDTEKVNDFIYLIFLVYLVMVFYATCQQAYNLKHIETQVKLFDSTANLPNDLSLKWSEEIEPVNKKILWHKAYLIVVSFFIGWVSGFCMINTESLEGVFFNFDLLSFSICLLVLSMSLKIVFFIKNRKPSKK
ncbi:hypothetical protein F971_00414 [Acinetobacter vivianii]|uniref:Uncharacterized protein n=1 Tax=Acinetobacter vivianii TaxID=1776742 RepID=N8V2B9_9GAMM|nr:hypothetical protein [Acinetobacter vivianii]ENU93976.1 hypothetical protein F971_00414 [Acinetobacter vivianii]